MNFLISSKSTPKRKTKSFRHHVYLTMPPNIISCTSIAINRVPQIQWTIEKCFQQAHKRRPNDSQFIYETIHQIEWKKYPKHLLFFELQIKELFNLGVGVCIVHSLYISKSILHGAQQPQRVASAPHTHTNERARHETRKWNLFREKPHFCAIKSMTLTTHNPQWSLVMFVFAALLFFSLPSFFLHPVFRAGEQWT